MDIVPALALPLLTELAPAFTQPTFRRAVALLAAVVLTTGRRTVANLLRTAGALADGHSSSYNRVLSQARWHGLCAAAALCRLLLRHFGPAGRARLVGDDTVAEHRGQKVYGKARHRDAVRSSHSYTAHRYGHKWVVLAVLVRFPFATRPWALPVLVALYRSPEDDRQRGRAHKTPEELMVLLLRVLLRWFPDREFVFSGDQGYGTHEVARFAAGSGGQLALVSRFYPDANLYEPSPAASPPVRPRKKGAKLPPKAAVAAGATKSRLEVAWYGGRRRSVEVVSGVGHWYKSGAALVAAPLGFLPEPLDHLAAVLGLGPLPAVRPAVEWDDGGPDPEVLPGVPVVLLGVERGVGQHPVPGDREGCLGHDRAELRGVVGRAGGGGHPPARKWVLVSTATLSLVHRREVCFLPARLKK